MPPPKLTASVLKSRGARASVVRARAAEEGQSQARLSAVMQRPAPAPPPGLHAVALALWHDVLKDYVLDAPGITLLGMALYALSMSEEARAILERDGLTQVDDKGRITAHPAAKIATEARAQYHRLTQQLGFYAD